MPIMPIVISHYNFLDAAAGRMDSGNVLIKVLDMISVPRASNYAHCNLHKNCNTYFNYCHPLSDLFQILRTMTLGSLRCRT